MSLLFAKYRATNYVEQLFIASAFAHLVTQGQFLRIKQTNLKTYLNVKISYSIARDRL